MIMISRRHEVQPLVFSGAFPVQLKNARKYARKYSICDRNFARKVAKRVANLGYLLHLLRPFTTTFASKK